MQIVKGWVEDGSAHEKVLDVACSDGGEPDPSTGRCPENGAAVDLSDCSQSEGSGDAQLAVFWTDLDFDPTVHAFYYVRVIENPTCRWSTWDALRLGIQPPPAVSATLPERAVTSPIWYAPEGD
jgi:hypothetical protein